MSKMFTTRTSHLRTSHTACCAFCSQRHSSTRKSNALLWYFRYRIRAQQCLCTSFVKYTIAHGPQTTTHTSTFTSQIRLLRTDHTLTLTSQINTSWVLTRRQSQIEFSFTHIPVIYRIYQAWIKVPTDFQTWNTLKTDFLLAYGTCPIMSRNSNFI